MAVPLSGSGAPGLSRVVVQRALNGRWRFVTTARATHGGRFRARFAPRLLARSYRLRVRLAAPPAVSRAVLVRSRDVTLDAVGDINLGDGVAAVMSQRGLRYPWGGVARTLRAADIAFGNLECAVSRRGAPVPKTYRFRGSPAALAVARAYAGMDVLNLANNHALDYGRTAFLDELRSLHRLGIAPVGGGANLKLARGVHVVTRLGLRVAFVGFSDIQPTSFAAGPHTPGTAFASPGAIRAGVRAARRRADLVIVSFHWGVERHTQPTGRQRAFAADALRAGATAVIAAHPHVLQPVERVGRHRLVAYSLGNFVWSAGSGLTARTGILELRLSRRGVERAYLRRATIRDTRPTFG